MQKDLHTILDWMLSTHIKPPHFVTEAMERLKNAGEDKPDPEEPKEELTA